MYKILEKIKNRVVRYKNLLKLMVLRVTPQKNLDYFCCNLVDHCNLNCKYCDHFSPLASERFLGINVFEKDFKRLSDLSHGKVNRIGLMGGEPLLHPNVKDFFYVARKYFPESKIQLITNGILLPEQNDDFWSACRENNIEIEVTKYPINTDYEKLENLAASKNVLFSYYRFKGKDIKTINHYPLDLHGKQSQLWNFINCLHANDCIFLESGRLYTCTVAPNIRHFNNYFKKNIELKDGDSIDIYRAKNMKQILQFLAKSISFCKNCYIKKRTKGYDWCQSKGQIEEWTIL